MGSHGYGTDVQSTQSEPPAGSVASEQSFRPELDLSAGIVSLTAALVDIPSESLEEMDLANAVEAALRPHRHLGVHRDGNTVVAMTDLGRRERVVIGGHLDTVPAAGNLPHRLESDRLYGLGACDMKGGVAVALKLAAEVSEPVRDVTYLFYECEEIGDRHNGLGRIAGSRPEWLTGDFAILMEPSNATIEAGCQGTIRVDVATEGVRAHSARSWLGDNAIHKAGEILRLLNEYQPKVVEIDGLQYREGMNAVRIHGGHATNVIPDSTVVTVNYRFAPSTSTAEAEAHLRELFDGFEVTVDDVAPGALPGLSHPAAASFVKALSATPTPKFGWTDVARFSSLGVPAVNFGPGDPSLAHTKDEYVLLDQLRSCEIALRTWLTV